jgi:hypothetical protein
MAMREHARKGNTLCARACRGFSPMTTRPCIHRASWRLGYPSVHKTNRYWIINNAWRRGHRKVLRRCLVCEEKYRCVRNLYVFMTKQLLQFLLCNTYAKAICAIQHKYDCLHIRVVMFPETSITPLSAHVIDREVNIMLRKFFNLEANCGSYFCSSCLNRRKWFTIKRIAQSAKVDPTFLGFKWLIKVVLPLLSNPTTKILASFLDHPIAL